MSDYKTEIGKRISYLRELNGLTQENLAALLDCSVKHVSCSERGASLFSVEKFLFLSDYFSCSLDYILKGADPSDVTSSIPSCMVEILQGNDEKERDLLMNYLNMYARIRKAGEPHNDENE